MPVPSNADRYRQLLAVQRQLRDTEVENLVGVLSPSSPVEVKPSSPKDQIPPFIQNPFSALNRPQVERPRHDSSPSAGAASPVESSEARHQRLLMMRQRLSSSGTILPADSPALSLPAFPTVSGQYGDVVAARMQRLQQRAASPPKQDQVWSNMQISPSRRPPLQSPNRVQLPSPDAVSLPDPEQLTRPF